MTRNTRNDGSSERFSALDGLRAFAMAAVVWHHAGPPGTFFDRGLGANIFFAISGFLITTLLLREQDRTGKISVRNFYVRRTLRIAPLYYAVLLAYVVLVFGLERHSAAGAEFLAHLPNFLTFTASWLAEAPHPRRVIFMFAWSLSIQEQFYLAWPWVVSLVRRRRAMAFLILAGLVVFEIPGMALTAANAIWAGCLVAYLLRGSTGAKLLRAVAGARWSAPVALGALLLPLAWPGAPQVETEIAAAYLVAACALCPGVFAPLLENRAARYVGSVTYGIYLLHMLAINVARQLVPGATQPVLFAIALPMSIVWATLSYRYFERPILSIRSRFLAPAPTPVGIAGA